MFEQSTLFPSLIGSYDYIGTYLLCILIFIGHLLNICFIIIHKRVVHWSNLFTLRLSAELFYFVYFLLRDLVAIVTFALSLLLILPGILVLYEGILSYWVVYSTFFLLVAIIIRSIWSIETNKLPRVGYYFCLFVGFISFTATVIYVF